MEKFTRFAKRPANIRVNCPQYAAYRAATIETHPEYFIEVKIAVVGDRVFNFYPKHYTGVINLQARGGKWEEVIKARGETVSDYISRVGAKPAKFNGGPRTK